MGRYPYLGPWQRERAEDVAAIRRAMDRCDVTQFADRWLSTLSGGERQRVRLARALAQEPSVLVLDEPTTFLDIRHEMTTFELLRDLRDEGTTVVLATHNLNLAARYADDLVLMRDGRLVARGAPADVLTAERVAAVYDWPVAIVPHAAGAPQVVPQRRASPMTLRFACSSSCSCCRGARLPATRSRRCARSCAAKSPTRAPRGRSPTRASRSLGRTEVARSDPDGSFVAARPRAAELRRSRPRGRLHAARSPTSSSTTAASTTSGRRARASRRRRSRRRRARGARRDRAERRRFDRARDRSVRAPRRRRAAQSVPGVVDHAGRRTRLGEPRLDSRIGRERSARARRRRADQLADHRRGRPLARVARAVERVVVRSGAQSARYGGRALAGVIEIDDAAAVDATRRCSRAPARGASRMRRRRSATRGRSARFAAARR